MSKKLDAALALEEKDAIDKGELARVTAIIAEREALESGDYPPEGGSEEEQIGRFREIWETETGKLEAERIRKLALKQQEFSEKLDDLIRTLTQERKIEEAMKVKAFRDGE